MQSSRKLPATPPDMNNASVSVATISSIGETHTPIQRSVVAVALALLVLVAFAAQAQAGGTQFVLVLVGAIAGVALYHASFGFTSAWRVMIIERRSEGVRAQLLMIGLTILVFFPLLAIGEIFGRPVSGFVNPVGVALCVGAFLFGIGMQIGGGCGSGTLYTAGGGSARMLVTLAAFIVGSVVATADPLRWSTWPTLHAFSLLDLVDAPVAILIALTIIGATYLIASRLEAKRWGLTKPLFLRNGGSFWRGLWPLVGGALALTLVNIATLVVSGRPWGITSAFALWGAKVLGNAGVDVNSWAYWNGDASLNASVFADVTSVMNVGLMLGALLAAGLAGRFSPSARLPASALASAIVGGLLLCIGARLSTGCNIGALFSGAASGSLHALVWLAFAIPGNAAGIWLRKRFQI